jgi:Multicopper oxidase
MRVSVLSLSVLAASLASLAFGNDDCQDTVKFPITLTWEKGAPDGFERDMILMNGQFPGPLLEMNEGDNVEVGYDRVGHDLEAWTDDCSSPYITNSLLKQQYISMVFSKIKPSLFWRSLTVSRQLNTPYSGARDSSKLGSMH